MRVITKELIGVVLASFLAFPAFAAVNINTGTQSELESVKGLGPAKAKAIIMYREANGNFKSIDELDNVKGLGKASIDKLRDELTIGAEAGKKK